MDPADAFESVSRTDDRNQINTSDFDSNVPNINEALETGELNEYNLPDDRSNSKPRLNSLPNPTKKKRPLTSNVY